MKRVLAMCLAVLMMSFLIPSTANAASDKVTISVTADKTTANPGDTIYFEVNLGAVEDLGGLDFNVIIPDGLTVDPDSVTMQEGLKDILKSDGDIVKPAEINSWRWSYSVGAESYTGASQLSILSFSCTVNTDAAFENKSVTLGNMVCFDGSLDMNDIAVDIVPALFAVEKAAIHVSGVTLDQASLTMKDGETSKLIATVTPSNADNQNVSWNSDNTAVATVAADGTVTTVKAGTANITVTTEDGGKTASCTIIVICDHSLTKTEAVAAACETAGNVEYWSCSKCGKKYANAEGTREITETAIPATGHTAGAWSSDGTNHWRPCTVCGKEIDKSAHTFQWVVDKAATEDETGLGHEECSCGVKRGENTEIPKLDHVHTDIQRHEAVAATCTTKGSVEYWTCSSAKCEGKFYSDSACKIAVTDIEMPVDPNNHVYDNDADSDCNLCGYKRFYVVTAGAAATYLKESENGLAFTADGDYGLFQSVEIDGNVIDRAYYEVKEGSTVVTLLKRYLDTLPAGAHTIRILYTDGKTASTQFTVQEAANDDNDDDDSSSVAADSDVIVRDKVVSPKTGDMSRAEYPEMILAMCAVMAALLLGYRKRNSDQ